MNKGFQFSAKHATGVVPICFDMRSGILEVIDHGVNGLIVKDRSADFLAAVRGLQSDPAKWRQLSLAARETVRQRYSVEACAQQWVSLLEGLKTKTVKRTHFQAPRMFQLPPPDPRFCIPPPPWKKNLKESIQSIPPLYRIAKAIIAVGRAIKVKCTG